MSSDPNKIDERTSDLMRSLVRQPPKLHDEMKLGKRQERKNPKKDSAGGGNKPSAKQGK